MLSLTELKPGYLHEDSVIFILTVENVILANAGKELAYQMAVLVVCR